MYTHTHPVPHTQTCSEKDDDFEFVASDIVIPYHKLACITVAVLLAQDTHTYCTHTHTHTRLRTGIHTHAFTHTHTRTLTHTSALRDIVLTTPTPT